MVPNLSEIIMPLHELVTKALRDKKKFIWEEKHQTSFRKSKNILAQLPTMSPPNFYQKFVLCTYATDVAIGASLNNQDPAGMMKPILFFS